MTDWSGQGLPPVAQRRIERAASSGVATSLLSVPGHVGVDASGYTPVGEAMGCAVVHLGFQGWGGCGWMGYGYVPIQTMTRRTGSYFGLQPYLEALDASWNLALGRMTTEATALGADGIVDVRLSDSRLDEVNREFVAIGTAVRSIGTVHVSRPFTTTLGGVDLAKLQGAGWTPLSIIVANAVGIRHDDWRTIQTSSAWAGNIEVPGYTDLVHATRDDCRDEFRRQARAAGADGAITTGDMHINFHEFEVSEGHRDHIGVARLIGTAIGKFERKGRAPSPALAMIPLSGAMRGPQ